MGVNLEAILGQFFTFNEEQRNQHENVMVECATLEEQDLLSQSTLRRKLFMCSPNRQSSSCGKSSKTPTKSSCSVKLETPDKNRNPIINSVSFGFIKIYTNKKNKFIFFCIPVKRVNCFHLVQFPCGHSVYHRVIPFRLWMIA